jgi:hypothetical protein
VRAAIDFARQYPRMSRCGQTRCASIKAAIASVVRDRQFTRRPL